MRETSDGSSSCNVVMRYSVNFSGHLPFQVIQRLPKGGGLLWFQYHKSIYLDVFDLLLYLLLYKKLGYVSASYSNNSIKFLTYFLNKYLHAKNFIINSLIEF